MDDLFALLDEDDDPFVVKDDASHSSEPSPRVDPSPPISAPKSIQERLSSSIDAQIGLRILNRKISGAEMMDMIAASVYRSPAVLSAMSLEDLNNHILIEPTMVVDASTVCGRTHFCTVGMVFSNSGTRTSSTGNAFCVLTLGTFASGPAISVLLFGTAYSKYVRTLTPGKVVFLENARLVPSKKNDRSSSGGSTTTISFSANNDREIQLVGDAQDFGICKGTTRGKNENGQWVENAKRCKNYVDTRECMYCKIHRQQSNVVDKSASGNNKMEKLRQESRDCPPQTRFPANQANSLQKPTNPAQAMMRSAAQPSIGSSVRAFHLSSDTTQKQPAKNPLLQDCSIKSAARQNIANVTVSRNPYTPVPPKVTPVPRKIPNRSLVIKSAPTGPTKPKPDLLGKIARGRPNANKRKLTSVNTDIGHFDGSVPVPKAKQFAPIHRDNAAIIQARQPKPSLEAGTKSQSDILQRQREIALQRRNPGAGKGQPLRPTPQNLLGSKRNGAASPPAKVSDIFGSVGKEEMARVMAAKSRFANEADAEEYARARQAVLELEKEEFKTLRQETKKRLPHQTNQKRQSSIKTEYFCVQCKRNFVKVPASCHQMHHNIRVDRTILGTQTTAEKRMMLSTKSVEDGGMTLAQGIDWSNRFSSRA